MKSNRELFISAVEYLNKEKHACITIQDIHERNNNDVEVHLVFAKYEYENDDFGFSNAWFDAKWFNHPALKEAGLPDTLPEVIKKDPEAVAICKIAVYLWNFKQTYRA